MASTTNPSSRFLATLALVLVTPGCPNGDSVPDSGVGCCDAGQALPDAGPCGEPSGYAAGANCQLPYARVESVPCKSSPAATCSPGDNVGPGQCDADADCPGGACVDNSDGCFCSAANCLNDADCPVGQACGCDGVPGVQRNACIVAECTTNTDCPGGECILSGGSTDCCDPGDARGFFCTTPDDQCRTNDGCPIGQACQLDLGGVRFVCGNPNCVCD